MFPERNMLFRGSPFAEFREEMERLLQHFAEEWDFAEEAGHDWVFEERENEVVMRVDLPGFEASELELRVEGNVFVVRAEHPEKKEEKEPRRLERHEYRFALPFGTDVNRIEANYRNGVLELHLPRLPEAEPRRIEVKT